MRQTLATISAAVSNTTTMAYIRVRNTVARCVSDERGQVGSIVPIGVLVVLAIVAGMVIFNAVKSSAVSTSNCISSPRSCANAAP